MPLHLLHSATRKSIIAAHRRGVLISSADGLCGLDRYVIDNTQVPVHSNGVLSNAPRLESRRHATADRVKLTAALSRYRLSAAVSRRRSVAPRRPLQLQLIKAAEQLTSTASDQWRI